jgi:ABC-2 type transport system permease protein
MLLTGLSYGSIANDAGDLIGDSEAARQMMVAAGGDLVAGFYAMAMTMLALLASGFAVSSALRPRAEELSGHAEALISTARSRTAWLGGHVAVTVLGTLVCLAVGGLGLGVGDALTTGDGGSVWQFTWQTLAWTPAVLALAAFTRLLYGVRARWAPLGWLGLGFAVVVLVLGEVLRFPDRLREVSPFEHLAAMPVVDFDPVAFTAVLGVAALMALAGWFTFIRRDVG